MYNTGIQSMKLSEKFSIFALSLLILSASAFAVETEDAVKEEKSFKLSDLFLYEKPVKKGDDAKKWFLNLSGGYTKKDGNTDSINTTYSSFIKYDDNHTVLKLVYNGSYGKYAGVVNENKGTGTLNFDYFLFWRIEFFSYTMSDYNKITMLTHRNGTGAGAKFYFIRNEYILVDLSGAPILQYEKYEENPAEKKWKWSIRGRVELFPFDDDFTIRYYAYYIPSMNDKDNYRTIQDFYFYKKLAGALGFKAGYRRDYNTYDKRTFEEKPLLRKTDSTIYLQMSLTL